MTVLVYSARLASSSANRGGPVRVWAVGGLDFGIPAEAVANLGLCSLPAATFAKCSPLDGANPILVVD
jgi:hypothetical protein